MKQKYTGLVVLNTLSLLLMLFVNYASNAGVFSNVTVADISHKYDTLFAPSGYAFIIWGFLFLLATCFVIYQWILLNRNDPGGYIGKTGIWFTLGNIANAAWVYFWINDRLGLCVFLMLLLLLSLLVLTNRLRLELDDEPVRTIFFVWWPITFYLGWIMVATVACVSAWLVSMGWGGAGFQESAWTIIMIATACLIYLVLIYKSNMREASIVGVWAFIAIAIRQWDNHVDIALTAIVASLILAVASGMHVYKNREYAVGAKLKRGEW